MKAAAYVRVSSRSQDAASQRAALERAAAARGDELVDWFVEKQSGRTLARPILDSVRELARRGHIRKLFVFRLDRLTRSGIRDTLEAVHELRAAGCELVTVADGFELAGPAADVVLAVLAWAAQMERAALGERIAAARARAETWGRPRAAGPAEVRRVLELADGRRQLEFTKRARDLGRPLSQRQIAATVGLSRATVAAILAEKGPYAGARERAGFRARGSSG
ncbi:MAG TPA: recombinase family protein [Gammaproteobacteria bacterium]